MLHPATHLSALLALILAAAAPLCAADADPAPSQRLVTLTLAMPPGPASDRLADTPAVLAALLKDGWRIGQCTSLGKSADGAGFVVALVLEREEAAPADAQAHDAADSHLPGRAAPIGPAKPGTYRVAWAKDHTSVLVVGAPIGARNPVTVTTTDRNDQTEVTYQATAFMDDQGILHVDGRGAPLSGPLAASYSPDSFAIHDDGSVDILDDGGHEDEGTLAAGGPNGPARDAPKEAPVAPKRDF